MSQDEQETKQVDETTPPAPEETKQGEDNASEADETAKDSASESESNEIDYEVELEKVKKQLSQAEYTIQQEKQKNKKKAAEETVDETIQESEGELTVQEFEKRIEQKFEQKLKTFQTEQTRDLVDAGLEALTDNPKERELIRFHYENSLNPSGYTRTAIKADLENAQLIANRKKLLAENRELKEALRAKASVGNASRGSNQDKITVEDEPNLTPQERSLLKRHAEQQGITLKEYLRRNKTRLTNE